LWANHGHGGHGNGVRRGVLGDGLSEKKITAGGRRSSFQENPCFWGPTSKVRPFDGTSTLWSLLSPEETILV
jgi:hypothetical protein